MILSVSRRTDIPAFYSEWFFNRIQEGFLMVRNPMNLNQVSKILLDKKNIECIVFWTKNPQNMIQRLDEIKELNYYFQFTLNPYDKSIESGVPNKKQIIETFKELATKIGKKRVVWRYDPIFINDNIDVDYHLKYFEKLSNELKDSTEQVVISILDKYKKTEKNMKNLNLRDFSKEEIEKLMFGIKEISASNNIKVKSCAEDIDLNKFGIEAGKCIDDKLISEIIGYDILVKKDKNQRSVCGCVESVEIGAYNTCFHGCKYCYANFSEEEVNKNKKLHFKDSPFIIGTFRENDKITERKIKSYKNNKELKLF